MLQPAASERPVITNRLCTPPSGDPSRLRTKRASRTGPLAVMNGGTTFFAPIKVATATCGFVAGLVPPIVGWEWHPEQLSRLNLGPRPSGPASTSWKTSFATSKYWRSTSLRPVSAPPAPGSPPLTPGSVGAPRDDAPTELLFCAAAALTVTASVVAALVVVVLVVTAVGFVVETFWANAPPDHATDPNNMAATAACVCARVNLIVSIFRSPKFYGASRKAFVPDIYWTRAARKYEVIMFLQRRNTATKQGTVASLCRILSMPEMFFVVIDCADDMPWLITTRVSSRRKRNRCANPIQFGR